PFRFSRTGASGRPDGGRASLRRLARHPAPRAPAAAPAAVRPGHGHGGGGRHRRGRRVRRVRADAHPARDADRAPEHDGAPGARLHHTAAEASEDEDAQPAASGGYGQVHAAGTLTVGYRKHVGNTDEAADAHPDTDQNPYPDPHADPHPHHDADDPDTFRLAGPGGLEPAEGGDVMRQRVDGGPRRPLPEQGGTKMNGKGPWRKSLSLGFSEAATSS